VALVSSTELVFGDAESRLITSGARVEQLAAQGFYFEACAAQSMIAEALLSLAMFTAVSARDDLAGIGLAKRMEDSAFGRLITLEANYRVFENPDLSARLDEYARLRNFLVDRHLPELQTFDYEKFLQAGRGVLGALGHAFRSHAYALLKQQGLPTDSVLD